MDLTRYGVWTSANTAGSHNLAAAAALAERLGFGAIWLGGSPRLPDVVPMLTATERIVVATGIVNVWQYESADLASEFAAIDADYPGRLLLGIGIGHPEATSVYEKPLTKMRGFFDGLASAPTPVPEDRLITAALGPKMLELSAARSLGTHPYFVPPAHTEFARTRLGPNAIIAPELAVVVDAGDEDGARASARKYAELYLGLSNYTRNLIEFGFTDDDISGGGSDRLIDTLVQQGSAAELRARVDEHVAAGADHVCVQTVGVSGLPEREWTAIAGALLSGSGR